jgi:hypothetical protein
MAGDGHCGGSRGVAEHLRGSNAARLPSYDFVLEDDAALERHFAPGTARAHDAHIEGAALHIALDPDTQSAEQTREAITRLIGPSDDQGGPRKEDR